MHVVPPFWLPFLTDEREGMWAGRSGGDISLSHTLSKHFQTKSTFTKQHFGTQIKSPSAMSSIRKAFCPDFLADTLIIYIKQRTLRDEISVSPIHSLSNRRDICIFGKVWFAKSGPCAKQIRTLKHRWAKAHSLFPH